MGLSRFQSCLLFEQFANCGVPRQNRRRTSVRSFSSRLTCDFSEMQAAGLVIYKLVEEKILYLLLQTSYGKHHWTPPKGFLDEKEDLLSAALRETKEEAGLSAEDLILHKEFKSSLTYFDPTKQRQKTVHYWLARLSDPKTSVKLSHEHQDAKWLEVNEASRLAEYPDLGELFRKAELTILQAPSSS